MHKNILDYDFLSNIISYDKNNGEFKWIKTLTSRAVSGGSAGYKWTNSSGKSYLVIGLGGKKYLAHNLAWLLFYKKWPNGVVDHLDGNGINNKICNLDDKKISENSKNLRLYKNNKLGIPGVYFSKEKNSYRAEIKSTGLYKNLISTKDFFEACCARKSAERLHGFHENHGTVRPL